ncbi:hypothetical protein OIV83_004517 [Microbotryomycetes sp. JL201]|nr:hypothetical protein OIV83_004517 [Microbotryomycetes sp. JL201]
MSSSSEAAPSLSLSIPPNPPELSRGRRITSWGSNLSETGSSSALDDKYMTPLPSPMSSRDWGFFPHSNETTWTSSIGRTSSVRSHRSESVFEEIRTSNEFGERLDSARASENASSFASPSSRTKTSSFFDSDLSMSPTPPPNPPSRGNSLRGPRQPSEEVALSRAGSWRERLDASASVWNRGRSDSGGSIGTATRTRSPDKLVPQNASKSPDSSATKPLLRALQTTTLRDEPVLSAASRPLTALPTPSDTPLNASPSLRPSKVPRDPPSSRPPAIDLSAAAYDPCSPKLGSTTPVTPSMDDIAAARAALDSSGIEEVVPSIGEQLGEFEVVKLLGKGAFSRVALGRRRRPSDGFFALKLVPVGQFRGNDRMRISVLREIEVLKVLSLFKAVRAELTRFTPQNVHHPALISLISAYETSAYSVLALEYAPGGELFDFINTWHANLTEPLVRRIFGELCSAVGWMHSIGLVHRDIKLENVLLMSQPFPTTINPLQLSSLPTPFVKLTDFGLSRFISLSNPTLSTRCGSEAYAAPELILARSYDGRQTDAWAMGVVLFALLTGVLPFLEDVRDPRGRKHFLLRIAKADWRWPTRDASASDGLPRSDDGGRTVRTSAEGPASDPTRLATLPAREVVSKLLVRDPNKRARVDDLWTVSWMQGEGCPPRLGGFVSPVSEGGENVQRPVSDFAEMWARRGSGL